MNNTAQKITQEAYNTFATLNNPLEDNSFIRIDTIPAIKDLDYDELLSSISSSSKFAEPFWIVDLLYPNKVIPQGELKINFSNFDPVYVPEMKEYALKQLLKKVSVHATRSGLLSICRLTELYKTPHKIQETNEIELMYFFSLLFGDGHVDLTYQTRKKYWVELKFFMTVMHYDSLRMIMDKMILPSGKSFVQAERYISENVSRQLDIIFHKNETIPITFKFIYWTLRLIPSRITEVLNIKDDCLKRLTDDLYTISIPTYKQEGPYGNTTRLISIKNEDIGKAYIELIKEQITFATSISDRTNNLICYKGITFSEWDETQKALVFYCKDGIISLATLTQFNKLLDTICNTYHICEDNGEIANVTSHCFRHNGVSDRLNSGLFREIDIQAMTYHAGTQMIKKSYTHTNIIVAADEPIFFKGKIVNTDNAAKLERLENKPFAMRIRNLGICSDTRACSKSKNACLFCEYLVPDYDNLEYYINQKVQWEKKLKLASEINNVDYASLCNDWITGYRNVINKIRQALSSSES